MYGRGEGRGQANIGIPQWIEEWGTRRLTGDQRRTLQYISFSSVELSKL